MHEKEVGKTGAPQIIAVIIFAISYILIFSGKIERSVAALLGLFMMVSAGYALGFMDFEDALSHVDWSVILLLFGMMTYVGLMAKTGFFKYLSVKAIKMAKGKPWLIFLYLSLITTFVSMVIDNVTTILLVVPLTVEIAEMLEINPVPVMLGEAVLSNVGGVATMIGDPPNIMIAFASKFNFNDFLINLFPPVATSLLVSILLGRLVYRKWVKKEAKNVEKLMEIDEKRYVRNRKKMNYYLYILFAMLFFFATETYTGISPAFVALSGGVIALIISSETPKDAFRAVEWPTLVFFIALFSLVGGLEQTGVLEMLARRIAATSSNVTFTSVLVLWVAGISSSFVDNIPMTAAFIPVISSLTNQYHSSILWWALAMGVGMGGNITPIGSSAGVITTMLSKRYGHEITTREWLKFGSIVGIASMAICSIFLLIM